MRAPGAPAGFVREHGAGALGLVRADLAAGARALGLLAPEGIVRAFTAGRALGGGRAPVVALAWPGGGPEVVVRRLRHGGLLGPLLGGAFLGPGRVLRELAVTSELSARGGALVPRPALALARRISGPLWECAIGTERVPGVDLFAALLGARSAAERRAALVACAEAVRALHDLGACHADLNAANLLLAPREGRLAASVIDLDRAQIRPVVPARRRAREIARLWRSLAKRGAQTRLAPGESEAFLAAYCASDATLAHALRAPLARERLRSALHAWRYPRG
ncbi:MAG TPA: lipopolysaccharide kinase InaA family protein [Myxococcota bacterium]|jgi:tRNA A-37 threonylcarbamoyl transferase component Bud32